MTDIQWLKKNPPIPQIVGVAMLGWALIPANPYGYYILMRIVLCGILVFLAARAHDLTHVGWVWVLAITAALYNPIVRVHLNREIWSVVNVATIALLIATVFALLAWGQVLQSSMEIFECCFARPDPATVNRAFSRDFNPLDIPPITANSLAPFVLAPLAL